MTISPRRIGAIALGLAVAAFAANAGLANSSDGTVCGIASSGERGMLALEGIECRIAHDAETAFAILVTVLALFFLGVDSAFSTVVRWLLTLA